MFKSLDSVAPSDTMFAFSRASEVTIMSPLTVKSLLTVASPLNITLKASERLEPSVPLPTTKAVAEIENESALVAVEDTIP